MSIEVRQDDLAICTGLNAKSSHPDLRRDFDEAGALGEGLETARAVGIEPRAHDLAICGKWRTQEASTPALRRDVDEAGAL